MLNTLVMQIVGAFAARLSLAARIKATRAHLEDLEAQASARNEELTNAVREHGPVVVSGHLLAVTDITKPAKASIGVRELIAGLRIYDTNTGDVAEEILVDLTDAKEGANALKAKPVPTLTIIDVPPNCTAPRAELECDPVPVPVAEIPVTTP